MIETMSFRKTLRAGDRDEVRRLVEATGFFRPGEVDVALELVDENLAKGDEGSGYHFLFAEREGKTLGYLSFGPIPCTLGSFDLYWIVVDPQEQGKGVGRALLREAEREIASQGGRGIYVETSSLPLYLPTRTFYERCGYQIAGGFPDFYAPGDGKVVYAKSLPPAGRGE